MRDEFKWGDGGLITNLINQKKDEILGPKPENWDKENPRKATKKEVTKAPKQDASASEEGKEVINELYVPKDRLSKMLS